MAASNKENFQPIDEEQDEDAALQVIGKKRNLQLKHQKKIRRQLRLEKRSKLEKYYSGSHFGESASSIAYALSNQLNMDTKDFFWFKILGITEMFITKKIDLKQYEKQMNSCKLQLNSYQTADQSTLSTVTYEDEDGRQKELKAEGMRYPKGQIVDYQEYSS